MMETQTTTETAQKADLKERYARAVRSTYAVLGRCHATCVLISKKIGKDSDGWLLVEGKADGGLHYWIEANGEILDPHYEIIGEDVKNYTKEKSYPMKEIKARLVKGDWKAYAENYEGKAKHINEWYITEEANA